MRGKYKTRLTPQQRFDLKVEKNVPNRLLNCWRWKASTNGRGYGLFWFSGKMVKAHHFSIGMPKCEVVMHTCDNPLCVNPSHLKIGTHKENAADRKAKGRSAGTKKTHCPQGHEYTKENVYLHGTRRHCKTCRAERQRQQRAEAYFKVKESK